MKNEIKYEWDYETIDAYGDIEDHNHATKLFEYNKSAYDCCINVRLVLVRDVGNDRDGLISRSWAYVDEDKKLPEYFTDSDGTKVAKVPNWFKTELEIYNLQK